MKLKLYIIALFFVAFVASGAQTPLYVGRFTGNGAGLTNLYDVWNVKWSGAVGNTNADDTAAVQASLNRGGLVYFPPGGYVCSNLLITVPVTISGNGATVVFRSDCTGWLLDGSAATLQISGLNFNGTNVSRNITNAPGSRNGVLLSASRVNSSMGSCNLYGFDGIALGVDGPYSPYPSQAVSVHDSLFYRSGYGVKFGPTTDGGEYTRFVGNELAANSVGIDCDVGNVIFGNCVVVSNNLAIKMGNRGNGGHGVFSACEINHNSSGIVITNVTLGETFSHCQILYSTIAVTNSSGVLFSGCNIYSPTLVFSGSTNQIINCTWLSASTYVQANGDISVRKNNSDLTTGVPSGNDINLDFRSGTGRIDANTSNLVLVASGGNVGVGTTNPIYGKVQIKGNGAYDGGLALYNDSGNLGALWLTADGSGDWFTHLAMGGDATKGITVAKDGHVSIGNYQLESYQLHVWGTSLSGLVNSTTPGFKSSGTNNMVLTCPDGGSWILRVANDGTLTTVTNSTGL